MRLCRIASGSHRRRPSNNAATTLACLALLATTARAMICYRCTVLPPQYVGDVDQPCSKFDASSRYYHDCPASTFCVKRIIHYRLPNGTLVTTAERNCASQKFVFQDYNYKDRQWHAKESVNTEIYSEGCFKGEDRGAPNGPSEYCYCSGDYCNASPPVARPLGIVAVLPFLLVLAVHLRSS
ncbi:uncharacterized protein LOC106639696 [Copidosoma floridanum]|uniref:uncharacterized protein LOC106639696 n=1 Tax=Copidosoma floridanum TaxID=29053 RepID=UPI0006C98AE9|nr:uncharacterized protein LOC106639696 [Copidosoma floridanum]